MPEQTEAQRQATFAAAGQQPVPHAAAAPTPITTPAPTPAPLSPTPIQNPVPASSMTPASTPTLPQPTAPAAQQNYFTGLASDVQTSKDALQAAYDKQNADISAKQDALKTQQQSELDAEQQLSTPFQADLEKTQEQQLHVNDNFDANQGLADELASLVNEANSRLTGETNRFASTSSITAGYNRTLTDITARAGLIQSAMSAYSGQISAAYTQIDRSVAAINADRNDQLTYYNTLLSLDNQDQLSLTADAKANAQAQIDTLKSNVDETQKSADAIKQAMIDPSTAQAYAQAGVTLTDTPEQINTKLGTYAYSKELSDQNNSMATNGFTAVIPGQSPPVGAQVMSLTDSKGNTKQYYSTSPKTQVVNLGNGSSRLINTDTGAVIASYGGGGGSGGNVTVTSDSGSVNVPVDVAPYVDTSNSGVVYADLSTVQGTAAQKKAIIDQAQSAGIKVITNANTALDLTNIKDANAKLDSISTIMAGIDQPNALSRSLYGLGLTKFATIAQTNTQQAAAGALQGVGLDILKAISGVQGFRGNSEVVQQITDHLPSIYDTNAVAQQKVDYIRQLIDDREQSILGSAGNNSSPAAQTYSLNGKTYTKGSDGLYYSQ